MTAPIWTISEAAQVREGKRWRNGKVEKIKQQPGFLELTILVGEKTGGEHRVLIDAASPNVRKHGENVPAKDRPPMKGWKPRGRKRWSDALAAKARGAGGE